MAIAKVILNGEVQMDVTSDTVEANKLLSGETATKNDGTKVTGTYIPPDPVISSLSVTPTESEQIFNDASVSGYKPVTVGAIASDYVGSAIPRRDNTDPNLYTTASYLSPSRMETYMAVPSGYYQSRTTKGIQQDIASISGIPTLSASTYIPTESVQYISSYQWLTGSQTIEAVASDYVGSAIPMRSAADMYANGSRVYAPSGYYSTAANAAVSSTSLSAITMAIISSTGNVTAELSYSAGYLTAGGTKAGNKALPTLSASTWTPGSTAQTISSYRWLTGSQTIAAIPSSYIIPSGTYSVTENGIYDIGSYASVDVSVAGGGDDTFYSILRGSYVGMYELSTIAVLSSYAFTYKKNPSMILSLPNVTKVSTSVFYAAAFSKIYIPNVTSISTMAFGYFSMRTTSSEPLEIPLISSLATSTFYGASSVGHMSFPELIYASSSAFRDCRNLYSIYAPKLSSIGTECFYNCNLRECNIDFPLLTNAGASAFGNVHGATYISLPRLTAGPTYLFSGCDSVVSAYLPAISRVEMAMFQGCFALESVFFSSLFSYHIPPSLFYSCSALKFMSFTLSSNAFIGAQAFGRCINLSRIVLKYSASNGALSYIASSAFANCYRLKELYFLFSHSNYNSLTLSGTDHFLSTPIGGYTDYTDGVYGSIYVPASLYSIYTKNSWSSYSSRVVSLTDEEIAALPFINA